MAQTCPDEVLELIFSDGDLHSKDLASAARTCRGWTNPAYAALYRTVEHVCGLANVEKLSRTLITSSEIRDLVRCISLGHRQNYKGVELPLYDWIPLLPPHTVKVLLLTTSHWFEEDADTLLFQLQDEFTGLLAILSDRSTVLPSLEYLIVDINRTLYLHPRFRLYDLFNNASNIQQANLIFHGWDNCSHRSPSVPLPRLHHHGRLKRLVIQFTAYNPSFYPVLLESCYDSLKTIHCECSYPPANILTILTRRNTPLSFPPSIRIIHIYSPHPYLRRLRYRKMDGQAFAPYHTLQELLLDDEIVPLDTALFSSLPRSLEVLALGYRSVTPDLHVFLNNAPQSHPLLRLVVVFINLKNEAVDLDVSHRDFLDNVAAICVRNGTVFKAFCCPGSIPATDIEDVHSWHLENLMVSFQYIS